MVGVMEEVEVGGKGESDCGGASVGDGFSTASVVFSCW